MMMRLLWALLALALISCSRAPTQGRADPVSPDSKPSSTESARLHQAASGRNAAPIKDQLLGEPRTFDNLVVFPVLAKEDVDVGPMTTLDSALARGEAEVRELGAKNDEGGPSVNTLVIENKGDIPIYVLAGTIVKGGNQDRQIGQDFILESKQTVPVDAYCVEQGRWNGTRDGRTTGGKFGSTAGIVTSDVRAAAQYKKNQGEVWGVVARVNKAHKKGAPSGTVLATLDDQEVATRRARLAKQVNEFLASAAERDNVVGFAHAVDGKIRGVRWFASRKVFELFRSPLASGAALDALTAEAERGGRPAPSSAAPTSKDVVSFVDEVDKAEVAEERDTKAANRNEYKETESAYGSKTRRKGGPKSKGSEKPVSSDYVSK
jgi:hypothetical protein